MSDPSNPVHKGSLKDGASGAQLVGPSSVYVTGRYAYVTSYDSNALEIVDISNPANPIQISWAYTGSSPYGVALSGNYAYLAAHYSPSFCVIDISNPLFAIRSMSG